VFAALIAPFLVPGDPPSQLDSQSPMPGHFDRVVRIGGRIVVAYASTISLSVDDLIAVAREGRFGDDFKPDVVPIALTHGTSSTPISITHM
jgi:hypothetical protein